MRVESDFLYERFVLFERAEGDGLGEGVDVDLFFVGLGCWGHRGKIITLYMKCYLLNKVLQLDLNPKSLLIL